MEWEGLAIAGGVLPLIVGFQARQIFRLVLFQLFLNPATISVINFVLQQVFDPVTKTTISLIQLSWPRSQDQFVSHPQGTSAYKLVREVKEAVFSRAVGGILFG